MTMEIEQREKRMDDLIELGLTENEAFLITSPIRQLLNDGSIMAADASWKKRNTLVDAANKKWLEENGDRLKDYKRIYLHGTTSKV